MTQPGFSFGRPSADQAEQYRSDVFALLEGGQWWKSRELIRAIAGWDHAAMKSLDRVVRQIAEESHGQIISGQKGYKLTRFATNDEIDHAERWLLSQARKMTERAVEIRKARNGRAA